MSFLGSSLIIGKSGKYIEFVFTAFLIFAKENDDDKEGIHATELPDIPSYKVQGLVTSRYKP